MMADPPHSTHNNGAEDQQLAFCEMDNLRRELSEKNETIFDLSLSLKAVEAETQHELQQQQVSAQTQLRHLSEQLRLAQHEANQSRAQANRLQAKLSTSSNNNNNNVVSPHDSSNHNRPERTEPNAVPPTASIDAAQTASLLLQCASQSSWGQQHQQQQLAPILLRQTLLNPNPTTTTTTTTTTTPLHNQQHFLLLPAISFLTQMCESNLSDIQLVWILLERWLTVMMGVMEEEGGTDMMWLHTEWVYQTLVVCPSVAITIVQAAAAAAADNIHTSSHNNNHNNHALQTTTNSMIQLQVPEGRDHWQVALQQAEQRILGSLLARPNTTTPPPVWHPRRQVAQQFLQTLEQTVNIVSPTSSSTVSARCADILCLLVLRGNHPTLLLQPHTASAVMETWELVAVYHIQQQPKSVSAKQPRRCTRLLPSDTEERLQSVSNDVVLDWLAATLRLVQTIIQKQSNIPLELVRRFLLVILDLLELVLVPNENLHTHPLTVQCVALFDTLVLRKPYDSILRLQMPTTASSDDTWDRGASAIGVAVLLFHTIVVRQCSEDHVIDCNTAAATLGDIGKRLVVFFHHLLWTVQLERRKTPAEVRTSFWSLLVEGMDLFTSAAALLLHSTTTTTLDPAVQEMLRIQMDELLADENDMEDFQKP